MGFRAGEPCEGPSHRGAMSAASSSSSLVRSTRGRLALSFAYRSALATASSSCTFNSITRILGA